MVSKLEAGDVLLDRRDGETLRLSKAKEAQQEIDTLQALAQLIASSLDDEACDRLADKLELSFPWIAFLPDSRRREFVGQFLRVARACASVGRFERLTIVLNSWRATAEAYADPAVTPDGSDLEYLDEAAGVDDPRVDE
ncbi:hypothetical protein QFW96_10805 [Saccharopolyspora sp. TS4A08]|uniref:Uncharacterized protein n=1 Tax=Saccharopolyspora ipomoeae TaxID=3042027 RepID=A0ABT6PM68_9PSEU|nr:hypothetical protein [Saccharopolyspora sp. TS4A08]MDI2029102.1 hypothetical protein [Saccharopolyspora sp. TS4A08]